MVILITIITIITWCLIEKQKVVLSMCMRHTSVQQTLREMRQQ